MTGRNITIGWGRRSLVPDRPVAIPGMFYLRVSQGVFNPVTVNALAIDNGDDSVIFVSADLVDLRNDLIDRIREKLRTVAPELPDDRIVMNATHTHAGPQGYGRKLPDEPELQFMSSEETVDFIASRSCEAIVEAWERRAPGMVAYGYGLATTGHSRRVVYHDDLSKRPGAAVNTGITVDGHGKMYGRTDDPQFSHYEAGADPFVQLLYTFDAAGKLTGAVVNVPCPAQTDECAWLLHAGYWHNVREKLRAKYGDIGVISQIAAAGDLSPRQLHGVAAEKRRYRLKYPEKYAWLCAHPFPYPKGFIKTEEALRKRREEDLMDALRAEDMAGRIAAVFDEVLEWAGGEKLSAPELRHLHREVKLERRMLPDEGLAEEESRRDALMSQPWSDAPELWTRIRENSMLAAKRARCQRVIGTCRTQHEQPLVETPVHAVRIGEMAFVTTRFELFVDFMHRIQARSPFTQTAVVELCAFNGALDGPYIATERAAKNRGFSATPYCNLVSARGGQQLVEQCLEMLNELNGQPKNEGSSNE